MKKVLYFVLVAIGVAITYFFLTGQGKPITITEQGDEVVLVRGDNAFTVTASPEFSVDLRVFGYNRNDSAPEYPVGPPTIVTHYLIATPMALNEEIFAQSLCEQASADQASMIQVIATDPTIKGKLRSLGKIKDERQCATVRGRTLSVDEYRYGGEPQDMSRISASGVGPLNFELWKWVLLEDINAIPCEKTD